ncbi:MAG: hypothetical protein OEY86_03350 [Nitrospira sp.]|nr:hypothetical protein [Nitrospira sp.]
MAEDRSPQTLLREASSYAARIDDDSVKHHVLQDILWAQQKIGDEVGAIQTAQLELSGNRDNALEIVVAIQASRGHIREAEATLRGISNHITRANAASHIPVAYAAVGDIPKALQLAAQLPNNYAARGDAFYRIAEIQANGGDVPGALATMKDEWDSNPYRLIPLLKVQLAAGSWDQAIQITKLAEDPWYRSYLLWAVAMNGKTHAQKRNVAATIPVRGVKAWAYKHIAEAQLTDGDLQGCLASLKVATQEAPATYNNFARADLQWRIAVLYAHAHDLVQAKRVAMVIEKEGHRNNALRDIIEIQVKEHDDTGALETALLGTSEDSLTDYALSRTAERQVVVESVDKAMDTILQIKNAESRNVAFASVANAAAEAGRIAAALKLLSVHRLAVADALRFVETTGASEQRKQFGDQAGKLLAAAHLVQHAVESTLGEIVKSRAGNGALQEALGYALLIPEASAESGRAIGRIAFHQTKAGNVDAALQWIARAQLPSHKAVALTGVAHALIAKEKK